MEVLVHAEDNGVLKLVHDGAGRHALNVFKNVLAFGPFGLGAPKNLQYQCQKCTKIFARNVYAHKRDKMVAKLIAKGTIVVRDMEPPSVIKYDPAAENALT